MRQRMTAAFKNLIRTAYLRFRYVSRDQGTEQVEYLLALILGWWAIYTYYYALFPWLTSSLTSTSSLGQLAAIWPLYAWASILLAVVFSQIVGTALELVLLRMIGAFGSFVLWTAIATILFVRAHTSPVWGGFAILSMASLWVFLRLSRDAYRRRKVRRLQDLAQK